MDRSINLILTNVYRLRNELLFQFKLKKPINLLWVGVKVKYRVQILFSLAPLAKLCV